MSEIDQKKAFQLLISGCKKGDLGSQKELYRQFYGYAMGICLRYSPKIEDAREIANDGFLKVFAKIETHKEEYSFKAWMRRIMINSSIDHFRANQKHSHQLDITHIHQLKSPDASALSNLTEKELLFMIQCLSPAYRIVFNLYAIEGYKHEEIAKKLGISAGTSKSNLARARFKLRKMLAANDRENFEKYG